jgi:histone acetyltransferase (RNA polymerase elongator complex component)
MAFGEEYDGVVECKPESGTCLYCPEGRESPVGSPKCQWGATKKDYKHPFEQTYPKIMP